VLIERFPMLRDIEVTHHWGGVMGMTRDMRSTVGFDKTTGEAWAGGFGGPAGAAHSGPASPPKHSAKAKPRNACMP
jgi:glycine/D-amino acid oxidase-like deaminating enzyme